MQVVRKILFQKQGVPGDIRRSYEIKVLDIEAAENSHKEIPLSPKFVQQMVNTGVDINPSRYIYNGTRAGIDESWAAKIDCPRFRLSVTTSVAIMTAMMKVHGSRIDSDLTAKRQMELGQVLACTEPGFTGYCATVTTPQDGCIVVVDPLLRWQTGNKIASTTCKGGMGATGVAELVGGWMCGEAEPATMQRQWMLGGKHG
ncbi:hypothetical protein B0H13DRAFT_1882127 [Mycena leptocephala]|nr:hypothetical protein B0H13DRAFT_1882127 [Mycena leptocephala]